MYSIILSLLPVWGTLLTFVLGFYLKSRGKPSMVVWITFPLITLVLFILTGRTIAENGNVMFAAVMGLFVMFLFVYYPGLVIFWLLKKRGKVIGKKAGDLENES